MTGLAYSPSNGDARPPTWDRAHPAFSSCYRVKARDELRPSEMPVMLAFSEVDAAAHLVGLESEVAKPSRWEGVQAGAGRIRLRTGFTPHRPQRLDQSPDQVWATHTQSRRTTKHRTNPSSPEGTL